MVNNEHCDDIDFRSNKICPYDRLLHGCSIPKVCENEINKINNTKKGKKSEEFFSFGNDNTLFRRTQLVKL